MKIRKLFLLWTAPLFMIAALLSASINPGDATKGKELFERRCVGCHRLDQFRIGPKMRNVFGSTAGSDPQFPYSDALKSSRIKWSEASLDKWLADPDALVPNNDMAFRVEKADERAALIAYLKSLVRK